jgi:hypothetical protein
MHSRISEKLTIDHLIELSLQLTSVRWTIEIEIKHIHITRAGKQQSERNHYRGQNNSQLILI